MNLLPKSREPRQATKKTSALWCVCLVAFCFVTNLPAANVYRMTLMVTNLPITGNTLVFSLPISKTIVWSNNTTTASVMTNTTIGGAATNLFLHFATHTIATPRLKPDFSSSNIVILSGETDQQIQVTVGGSWASVTYTTNAISAGVAVAVRQGGIRSGGTTNTEEWIASQLVQGLSDKSTNAFAASAFALSNHVNLSTSQTLGNKKVTNSYFVGPTASDGTWTNFVNKGNAIRSEGVGANSLQLGAGALAQSGSSVAVGVNALATNANTVAVGTGARATNASATAVGNSAFAPGENAVAIGGSAEAQTNAVAIGSGAIGSGIASVSIGSATEALALNSLAIGQGAVVSAANSIAIGSASGASQVNAVALGAGASSTATNQIRLGGSDFQVSSPGIFLGNSHSNTTFTGTNIFAAKSAVGFTPYALGSLATGNNAAIPIATNVIVEIASGPGAAFTINGIDSTGRIPGQLLYLVNLTGFNMTIAHQSGTDPTAANRIITMTGADHATTGNGTAQLYYSTSQSRWILLNLEP